MHQSPSEAAGHAASLGFTPPPGSVDCHFHVFDDRYTTIPGRKRPQATLAEYLVFRARLGLERSVIIAPSSYGLDNSCLLEALDELGPQSARAVVIVAGLPHRADIDRLHRAGTRGIRLFTSHADFPDPEALYALAVLAADAGWHLQLVGKHDAEPFARLEPLLASLPCDLVFDHFGFAPQPGATSSTTADTLRRLLDGGRAWVKASGMYIQSKSGPPHYEDFDAMAIDLVARAPERILWGSDWPHTLASVKPDGCALLGRLAVWAPTDAFRKQILVDNPNRLYWST
jgi:predicted TIM-barrel fold metal-dependent hydrolase